ncbi:MAG: PEGA domain-containing protein [bacterium]|nr:PEGA domain-containing protein [bacterium]
MRYRKELVVIIVASLAGAISYPAGALSSDVPIDDTTAEVNVYADVKDAKVMLDGDYLGSTPVELARVEAGPHTLTFDYKSYLPLEYEVEVETPRSDFYFQLKPALMKAKNTFDVWDALIIGGLVVAAAAGAYFWGGYWK